MDTTYCIRKRVVQLRLLAHQIEDDLHVVVHLKRLRAQPRAEQHLVGIVADHQPLHFEGFLVLHEARPQAQHKVQVEYQNADDRHWRFHEQPVVHLRIYAMEIG